MADNTTLNPGVGGDVVAADDIGGVKYQRVKITYGANGSSTDVSDANPLPQIDFVHEQIHEGNSFTAGHYFAAVAASASVMFRISVGASNYAHILFDIAAGAVSEATIDEGTTFSAPGTALTEFNLDRSSATVADVSAFHTPTVNVAGTTMKHILIPGANKASQGGGDSAASRLEWILDKSTEYLVTVTNNGTGAEDISINATWYEVS
jgi:hypothetical protein